MQYECPIGYYCDEGSYQPTSCPAGYFVKTKGSKSVSDCQPCGPGKWCNPSEGVGVIERNCSAGYICVSGKMRC